jgi:hypothetical protein
MEDLAALVLRGLKFCGKTVLALLDVTNTRGCALCGRA